MRFLKHADLHDMDSIVVMLIGAETLRYLLLTDLNAKVGVLRTDSIIVRTVFPIPRPEVVDIFCYFS